MRQRRRIPTQSERAQEARGRAARPDARLDPHSALALVKVIAEFVCLDDPLSVTMRAFNLAREPSGHPTAPTAEAVLQRFNERRPHVKWREIIRVACSEAGPGQWLAAMDSVDRGRSTLTDDDCFYALQVVARELDATSFPPGRYDRVRRELIARDARRQGGGLLAVQLPTANQITYGYSGDWAAALVDAGLEPYRQVARSSRAEHLRGMPVTDAIEAFAEANGRLPGKMALQKFCRLWDVVSRCASRAGLTRPTSTKSKNAGVSGVSNRRAVGAQVTGASRS